MPKHLYLLFFATFVLGMVAGVVILLQTKTGTLADDSQRVAEDGFSVGVRAYGGCVSEGCPSYFVSDRGAYTYIVRSTTARVDGFDEGQLTKHEYGAIEALAQATDFEALTETAATHCAAHVGGTAYTFEITDDGMRYTFDTCKQDIEGQKLFSTLIDYVTVFEERQKASQL